MELLIRLDTTLTSARYASILPNHLDPFMSIVHSDGFGGFQQENATPPQVQNCYREAPGGSSEFKHLNWPPKSLDMNTLLNISGMPCNVLFRRDPHPLLLLPIYGQSCRIHGVNYLQHYFRH
ncbi:uncharacterized protein TNCV_43671 [Trichonephila clavipes]|nr:uncharacterized protein TNCV_43671 [Trichonephila clavipes]